MEEIDDLKLEFDTLLASNETEKTKEMFDKLLSKYQKSINRLEKITKQSDKQQSLVLSLNEKLDSYKEHLEERIKEATNDISNLNQELVDTQREIIFRMGSIGESRSKETGNHVKRVAEYSKLLGLYYGLRGGEKEAELLKEISPMHDIGKVAIPDNILNKPGKLTPEEFEIMKTHAVIGYEMLKHSNREILKASSIVALTHHEKWDGSGYPKKLKGEEIHIFGRITAIADVIDALGHDRVYKKAWDLDKILELFREEKGKHFDPELIDIFFDNLDEILEIRDSLKDIT